MVCSLTGGHFHALREPQRGMTTFPNGRLCCIGLDCHGLTLPPRWSGFKDFLLGNATGPDLDSPLALGRPWASSALRNHVLKRPPALAANFPTAFRPTRTLARGRGQTQRADPVQETGEKLPRHRHLGQLEKKRCTSRSTWPSLRCWRASRAGWSVPATDRPRQRQLPQGVRQVVRQRV